MTVQDLYQSTIRPMPPEDRLRLASLILDELTAGQKGNIDISNRWTEEDVADLAAFSATHAPVEPSERNGNA